MAGTESGAGSGVRGGLLRALLRSDPTSSFSDLWYRVGPTKPQLSPHAHIVRQTSDARAWYIVEDPAGGQYYRLSEAAYFFVGLLDGRRSVDEAWAACNAQLGDDAPTQRECVELLSRLQLFGLIAGDFPLAGDTVSLRRQERRERRLAQRSGRGLAPVVPLLNPEPVLARCRHLIEPLFSPAAAMTWAVLIAVALYRVMLQREALLSDLNGLLEPANLVWIGVSLLLLRAWHELGHACAVKAMGGRCTEVGLIFVAYLLPFPYCDTSSAWRFRETRARVIVSLGGVLFESVPAALAAIAWSFMGDADAGTVRTLLYNVMLVSGVTTLVFNLNPLMRYDGYYVVSDVLGVPNLAPRAQELLKYVFLRRVLRVTGQRPPAVHNAQEFWLLIVYALLSMPYRLVLMFSVVALLWTNPRYLGLGIVVAVVAGAAWIAWPLAKGAWFLLTSHQLLGKRDRALGIVGGTVLGLVLLLAVIPMPAGAYASGVIESREHEVLRVEEFGFVDQVMARPGDVVKPGQAVLTLRNPELMALWQQAVAGLTRARAEADAASGQSPTAMVLAQQTVEHAAQEERRARARVEALTLRARVGGTVATQGGFDLATSPGRFLSRGAAVGEVISRDSMFVRCLVPDRVRAYVFRQSAGEELATGGARASIRVRGQAWSRLDGVVTRVAPAGQREVDRAALGSDVGGEVIMDPADPERRRSLSSQYLVEVTPERTPAAWQAGIRARVRLAVPPEPLAAQWVRRLREAIAERGGA